MPLIELNNIGLMFQVRKHGRISLKDFMVRRMFRSSVNPFMEIRALRDVSFRLTAGDRLGIIGHNGAGKSSLLKLLAGVYPPTEGKRTVQGRISSLFDISLGFEGDSSGWENIALRGYLQGETPVSIKAKMQQIAEFAELGEFLDMPVRYYSAGMHVRLAFSIATAIEPEILLIDEALSAGDLSFQQKARRRMTDMIAKAQIMVLVSHDMDAIASMCNQAIWLDHGAVRATGPVDQVIRAYRHATAPASVAAAA